MLQLHPWSVSLSYNFIFVFQTFQLIILNKFNIFLVLYEVRTSKLCKEPKLQHTAALVPALEKSAIMCLEWPRTIAMAAKP